MFESGAGAVDGGVARLRGLVALLASLDSGVEDAVLVERIRALEELKAACAAAQARDAAAFDASRRAAQAAAGVPAAERGRDSAAQVALARRDSPRRGGQHLGLAKALVAEMPHTLAALQSGRLSEWRATILVRETAVLTREDRSAVDAAVAADADAMEKLGDRALAARVAQVAYRLDPRSVVNRAARAEQQRCVSVRPAPDAMAYLTALLPVKDAVTVQVALDRAAQAARAGGDERSRGQLMADGLVGAVVGALVGPAPAGAAAVPTGSPRSAPRPAAPDVAVRLVMTDRALLDGDDEPAVLEGHGPVPSAWARELVAATLAESGHDDGPRVFLTRLFTDGGGRLVGMESGARLVPAGLARLIRTRDGGTCRTPWCDAPIRHVDHVVPHALGGPTSEANSAGLCVACNLVKEHPGWHATVAPPGTTPHHTTTITTPTGHRYVSEAPPVPGAGPRPCVDVLDVRAERIALSPLEEWARAPHALAA